MYAHQSKKSLFTAALKAKDTEKVLSYLNEDLKVLNSAFVPLLYTMNNDEFNTSFLNFLVQYKPKTDEELSIIKKALIDFVQSSVHDPNFFERSIQQFDLSDKFCDVEKRLFYERCAIKLLTHQHFAAFFVSALNLQKLDVERVFNASLATSLNSAHWLMTYFDIDYSKVDLSGFLLKKYFQKSSCTSQEIAALPRIEKLLLHHSKKIDASKSLHFICSYNSFNEDALRFMKQFKFDESTLYHRKKRYDAICFLEPCADEEAIRKIPLAYSQKIDIFEYSPVELLLMQNNLTTLQKFIDCFNIDLSKNHRNVFDFVDYNNQKMFQWLLFKYENAQDLDYATFKKSHIMKCVDNKDLEFLIWLVEKSNFQICAQDIQDCFKEYMKYNEFSLFDAFRTTTQRDCLCYLVQAGGELAQEMREKLLYETRFEKIPKKLSRILDERESQKLQAQYRLKRLGVTNIKKIKEYLTSESFIATINLDVFQDKEQLEQTFKKQQKKHLLNI